MQSYGEKRLVPTILMIFDRVLATNAAILRRCFFSPDDLSYGHKKSFPFGEAFLLRE